MADDAARIAQLEAENAALRKRDAKSRERADQAEAALAEALEQQTATADILRVIASSPTELRAVLETVAENAARLCGADNALMVQREGDMTWPVALYGQWPDLQLGLRVPVGSGTPVGRALRTCQTVHVHDTGSLLIPVGRRGAPIPERRHEPRTATLSSREATCHPRLA
jgi:two-component system NtrC family sensor kinase